MEVTITVPQTQFMTESPEQVGDKIRLYAALGMYQAGVISIGAACEFAMLNIYDFHALLKRHDIPIMTQSAEQFEAEWQQSVG